MNIFKKLFGGQKTTEEVKQEKEKERVLEKQLRH